MDTRITCLKQNPGSFAANMRSESVSLNSGRTGRQSQHWFSPTTHCSPQWGWLARDDLECHYLCSWCYPEEKAGQLFPFPLCSMLKYSVCMYSVTEKPACSFA